MRKLIPVLVLLLLMGCAGVKPISEMSAQEKAAWFLTAYNAQYDSYLAQAAGPLTDTQREVLRAKRQVLTELHPLLLLYAKFAYDGGIPPVEIEVQIIRYIDRLLVSLEGGAK
jgi:hypothetical protein